MATSSTSTASGAPAGAPAWRDVLWLAVVVAVGYLITGFHPALSSSTRYDEACREMVELGDWIVPHLGYVPYLEKPILTYWLGAACQAVWGSGPYAAHAPSALATWVSAVATYVLGTAWRGAAFGLRAAILFLGSGYVLVMASVLGTDTVLSACLAVTWAGFGVWELAGRTGRGVWAFWVGLALGGLAKGPIAVVLPGLAIAGYALLRHGPLEVLRLLWALHPVRGVAILVAVNLPWSLAVWQRDARLLEYFYVRINYEAFFDPTVNHPGPWWYYLPLLPAVVAPATVVALPLLLQQLGTVAWSVVRRVGQPMPVLLLSGILFPGLFLSLSSSKLGTYLLPLMPLIALVVAEGLRTLPPHGRWPRALLTFQAVLMVLLVGVAIVVAKALPTSGAPADLFGQPVDLSRVDMRYVPVFILAAALLALGTVAAAAVRRIERAMLVLGITGMLVVGIGLTCAHHVVPDLDNAGLARRVLDVDAAAPVVLQTAVAHDFELLLVLRRRVHYVGAVRELGLGHWCEQRSGALPPKGAPGHDPYQISGETLTGSPWLWSYAELARRWTQPERLWAMGDDTLTDRLHDAGCTWIVVGRAQDNLLLTNHPLP